MGEMPVQKPGRSEQVVSTPIEFIHQVQLRLGEKFEWDLAADESNYKAKYYFTEKDNALEKMWRLIKGWCWLNPPYGDIEPWVEKAYKESQGGAKVAVLLPASVGSNWWATWVDRKAYVTFLNGRLTFDGHTKPYPKDCVLLLYAPFLDGGSCVWKWK